MQNRTPSTSAGLAAGFLAGLAGSAAKAAAEAVYPPRIEGQKPPPVVLVRKIAGHRLGRGSEARAMKYIHYGFGALVGAAYGWLAEYHPRVTAGSGALFGPSLNVMTRETTLPLLGCPTLTITAPFSIHPEYKQASRLVSSKAKLQRNSSAAEESTEAKILFQLESGD